MLLDDICRAMAEASSANLDRQVKPVAPLPSSAPRLNK